MCDHNYPELFTRNLSCFRSKLSLNNMNHHQDKRGSQLDIIIDQVLTARPLTVTRSQSESSRLTWIDGQIIHKTSGRISLLFTSAPVLIWQRSDRSESEIAPHHILDHHTLFGETCWCLTWTHAHTLATAWTYNRGFKDRIKTHTQTRTHTRRDQHGRRQRSPLLLKQRMKLC